MIRASLIVVAASGASVLFACDWGRFNRLKQDTPVLRLEQPEDHNGQFGDHLVAATLDDRIELYVAGSPRSTGGLVFSLGNDEDPEPNPTDEQHCPATGGDDCDSVTVPAGLNQSWTPSGATKDLCFVSGFGNSGGTLGLWTRCDDGYQFAFPVPADTEAGLRDESNDPRRGLVLATNRTGEQVLLAATVAQARAWYYEPGEGVPIDVVTPDASGNSFGSRVSVARVESAHLLAVTEPAEGRVWVYRAVGGLVEPIACLSGGAEFGRAVTSGDVDGDGAEDFVIAESDGVAAYSGAVLSETPTAIATDSCAPDDGLPDPVMSRFECENTDETTGCGISLFGEALAVADVDGDGDGEVFVGAPRMEVRGAARAGAVLAFDADGDFIDVLLVSDVEEKDEYGGSLVALPQGDREIVGVGALGKNAVYLHYCAAGSDGGGSPRCQ